MNYKIKRLLLAILMSGSMLLASCSTISIDDTSGATTTQKDDDTFYRVDFVNYDNSYLYSCYVTEGEIAKYDGPTPTKTSTETKMYQFIGWDKDVDSTIIKSNTTFTATYKEILIQQYVVTFVNYDGSELFKTVVKSGETAVYEGDTPTRPQDDDGTSYVFAGWNKSTENIFEDTVVVATYTAVKNKLVVTYVNYDGSILDVQYAYKGDSVSYHGTTPSKPSYQNESYEFSGWDKDTADVQENMTVTAVYITVPRILRVTFYDYDGTILYETNVDYGASVYYSGQTPSKPVDGRYEFKFDSWSKDTSLVQSDLDVFPIFKQLKRQATYGLSFSRNYDYSNGGYYFSVSSYWGSDEDIYIPTTYDDGTGEYPVRQISYQAFYGKSIIKSIFIEDGVSSISDYAFYNCNNLKSVRLPEGLTYVGYSLFGGCLVLERIEIPASLTEINRDIFSFSRENIELIIDKKNPSFTTDGPFIMSKDKSTLFFAYRVINDEELKIPSSVKIIKENALHSCAAKKITLPVSLTSIEQYAFSNMSSLTDVNFNFASCDIGGRAFEYCYSLRSIANYSNVIGVGSSAFCGTYLESFTIYPNLTTLYFDSFADIYGENFNVSFEGESDYFEKYGDCIFTKDLTNLCYLPKGVINVLKLPKQFVNLDSSLFGNSYYQILSFEVEEGNTSYKSIDGSLFSVDKTRLLYLNRNLTELSSLPVETTIIETNASYQNGTITKVDLSNTSVTDIRTSAFSNCSILTTAKVKFVVERDEYGNQINDNGGIFSSCHSLKNLTILSGTNEVPSSAFAYCSNIGSISFPSSVKRICSMAFYDCESITELTLPSTVESVDSNAFGGCNGLKSVYWNVVNSNSGSNIFSWCTIDKFILGDNVETFSYGVIEDMYTSSNSIFSFNVNTEFNSSSYYLYTFTNIYIRGTMSEYLNRASFPSALFSSSSQLYFKSSTGSVELDGVKYEKVASTVTISNQLTNIPSNMFIGWNCSTLILPNSVKTIGYDAFGSSSISKVVVDTNLTYIEYQDVYILYKGNYNNWTTNVNSSVSSNHVYFYSEDEPTDTGNYWHYNENNEPEIWVIDLD